MYLAGMVMIFITKLSSKYFISVSYNLNECSPSPAFPVRSSGQFSGHKGARDVNETDDKNITQTFWILEVFVFISKALYQQVDCSSNT